MAILSNLVATTGQLLGLPEYNISEKLSNTGTQTVPAYTGGGILGEGGYVRSPVPGGSQVYPISGGQYTSGPLQGLGAPISNPQPQNIPQSQNGGGGGGSVGGGGGGNINPMKIQSSKSGYFNANGDWVSMNSPEQEATYRQQLDEQLNASYNPAYANLNTVEAQYRQEYPTSQQFIEQSYGSVLPELQSEQQTKLQGLESQRTKGKQEEKSQLSKARQLYNELRQGGLTRFGGASSTGEAYGELLGRTTAQQMNEIGQNFGNMYGEIAKEEANVNDFYAKKRTDLEKEKQLRLQELKNQFDQTIREINTKRTGLDSEKAARRLAALQEYSAQARQMQFEAAKFSQQLDTWKAAKDEAVSLARQFNAKSFTIPSMPGGFGGFSITGTNQTGGTGTNFIGGKGSFNSSDYEKYGYFRDPLTGKLMPIKGTLKDDENIDLSQG